ncbi:hypothetical protein CHS0354_028325 [Potamilus streckersoni]|uniref:Uncharacterized protein n=1 Tax=Potamilus streckersoni TaxID=2493646 RepID=A0AAE0RTQ6_9BIVA|nr:hypothetical protein CHS0354_028325 [Potamilus streckersoni]
MSPPSKRIPSTGFLTMTLTSREFHQQGNTLNRVHDYDSPSQGIPSTGSITMTPWSQGISSTGSLTMTPPS